MLFDEGKTLEGRSKILGGMDLFKTRKFSGIEINQIEQGSSFEIQKMLGIFPKHPKVDTI